MLKFGAAGLALSGVFLASSVGAGDVGNVGNGLQVAGTIAGAAGQPELSLILTYTGQMMTLSDGMSPPDASQQILHELNQVNIHLATLDSQVNDLITANNAAVSQEAVQWNHAMIKDIRDAQDRIKDDINTNLIPLGSPPLSNQIDYSAPEIPNVYFNSYHRQAYGASSTALDQADEFIGIGLNVHGACGTGNLISCDSVNQKWISEAVVYLPTADRDANNQLRSYSQVPSKDLETAYEFQPGIGLAAYFASLRVAIAAMEEDLGGDDMTRSHDAVKQTYFANKYAHAFDRHIAFLTYYPAPDDPGPDGEGDADFNRYYNHTYLSLSDSYRAALHFHQAGVDPTGWKLIDEMRDLLTYAGQHGTARGWHYVAPAYIREVVPVAKTGRDRYTSDQYDPHAASRVNQAQAETGSAARSAAFLLAAGSNGDLHQINLDGTTLSDAGLVGHVDGVRSLASGGGGLVYAVDGRDSLVSGVEGADNFSIMRRDWGMTDHIVLSNFGGGEGVIYAIYSTGLLMWSNPENAPDAPLRQVGSGWAGMRLVAGAGQGIIYAVNGDGELLWYHHRGYRDGSVDWEGPVRIATGWGGYVNLVACDGGILIAVKADGTADYYRHDDYLTGISRDSGAASRPQGRGGVRDRLPAGGARAYGLATLRGPARVVTSGPTQNDFPQLPHAHLEGPIALDGVNLAGFTALAGNEPAAPSGRIN